MSSTVNLPQLITLVVSLVSAFVASTPVSLEPRQTSCDQTTNFLLYANTTGAYSGHSIECGTKDTIRSLCSIFFDPAIQGYTNYSLDEAGNLVVISSSQTNDPPIGNIAYVQDKANPGPVFLASPGFVSNSPAAYPIFCAIVPSEDADGTCDLKCGQRRQVRTKADRTQSSLRPGAEHQWSLNNQYHKVQIKVSYA